jgi:nitrogen fixation protein FixH
MKIKFNWGTGIFIVIVFIFLGVIGFFIFSANLDINLVEKNYYEKELVYEQRISHMRNANNLPEKIRIESISDRLVLHFPDTVRNTELKGTIWFYRPSDESKDFTVPINLDDSLCQSIAKERISPGKYTLKIDWEMAGTRYYQEEVLINE